MTDNTTTDRSVPQASSGQQGAHPVRQEGHAGGAHGSTPAAWTAVVIVLVGFTLGAIAMVMGPNWPLFWIAVAVTVVGALAGKVLQLLGFGAKSSDHR